MSRTVVSKIWDWTTLLTPLWLSATPTYVEFAITSFIFSSMIFFIIPKTTGFGLSKRRVSFHKTTRIFFEGFSHPSFFVLGSESAPGSGVARLFVSLLFFARSCCFFACFSTFLWLNSPFFLIILVVLILCVLLRRGSYNHWKQPAKVQNLSRQKCRLLYFYGACLYIIPKTTGFVFSKRRVSFHKTTGTFLRFFHTIRPWHPLKKYPLSLRMQRNLKWKSRVILVKYFCNYLLLETKSISFAS